MSNWDIKFLLRVCRIWSISKSIRLLVWLYLVVLPALFVVHFLRLVVVCCWGYYSFQRWNSTLILLRDGIVHLFCCNSC